jgi:hypothetical protein
VHHKNKKKLGSNLLNKTKMDIEIEKLIAKAHNAITRTKGKEYAPTATEIQEWLDKNVLEK